MSITFERSDILNESVQFSFQTLRVQIERFLQSQISTGLSQTLSLTSLFSILVRYSTLTKPILQIKTLATSNAVAHSLSRLQCLAAAVAVHSPLRSYRRCLLAAVYSSLRQFLLQSLR